MRQLELDGVALSYEEAGEGEPPVLLVHGWCCDHTYFAPQFEHFVKKVAVSWPWTCAGTEGATSRTNRTRCRSLPTILRGCASWLRLEKPAVVGHSMAARGA